MNHPLPFLCFPFFPERFRAVLGLSWRPKFAQPVAAIRCCHAIAMTLESGRRVFWGPIHAQTV